MGRAEGAGATFLRPRFFEDGLRHSPPLEIARQAGRKRTGPARKAQRKRFPAVRVRDRLWRAVGDHRDNVSRTRPDGSLRRAVGASRPGLTVRLIPARRRDALDRGGFTPPERQRLLECALSNYERT